MNKKLRYGLLTLLAFMGLTLSAQTTFDFDNDYATLFPDLVFDSEGKGFISDNDAVSIEKDGFKITVSEGTNSDKNANCIWNKTPRLRIYSGTLTISGSGIETIKFIHTGNFTLTTSTGELVGNVWTGNANSVVFTCGENSTQLKQIIINSVIIPIEPEEVSISQFLDKEDSEDVWYQLTGTVKNITNKSKGYFDLEDASGNSVYVYGLASECGGGLGIFSELNIAEDDILTIVGNRYTFTNSNGESKDEVTNAYFVSVEKSTVTPPTEDELNHGTESNPISVAEAVEAAKVIGREDYNNVSEEEFYVTGTITKINTNKAGTVTFTYSTGTATYFLGDDSGNSFEIYKGLYFEGYECTGDLPDIEVGIDVVVRGKIKYYQGKQPEFDEGSILVLLDGWKPGALPDPVTYTVNVEEARDAAAELDKNKISYDYYKVTGYVVGTPEYRTNTSTGELYGDVRLYIADEINGTPTLYIYKGKNKNNELFTESDLNKFTTGDKVTFLGKLQNYVAKDKETGEEADPVYELVEGYLLNYEVSPTVTVTMPSSGLATFCPARPILVEDQEVYIAKELQEDKVLVERVSGKIAAGVGLLIKGEESVEFDVEESGEEPEGNLLVGVLDPKELEEGEAFILVGGSFHPCSAGTFPAGKAYLEAEAVSGAKVIVFGGETTGINEVKAQDSSSEIYTIGGIRVKNAQQKGVYIINGKKVVK